MAEVKDSLRSTLLEAIEAGANLEADVLQAAFDELEPASSDFLLGTWRGGVFHYDHHFGRALQRIGWYGKRFNGRDDVEPILVRGDDGTVQASAAFGQARLRDLLFRGTVSVAMLYDNQPLIDHFRKVTDDIVLGLADEKGRPSTYFFYLQRD
jgi:hypothetical protein